MFIIRLEIICVFATVFADNSSCVNQPKTAWKVNSSEETFQLDLVQYPPLLDPKSSNFLESFSNIHETNNSRATKSPGFTDQLNNWFPNLKEFNQKFVQFLRQKGLNDDDFSRVLDKEHFITSTKRYLKEFSSINQSDYVRGLHKQIGDILINYYDFNPTSVESPLTFIDAANFTISSDYFYDKYVIKSRIEPLVSQFKHQQKFMKLNDTLTVWYPTSINLNSIVVKFLMLKNIKLDVIDEISENKTKFNEYLLNHVYEISQLHKTKVEDGIYDQIRIMLREDYPEFHGIHEEIISELKKNKKMASSYWLNLIYDNELLRKIVRSPLNVILERKGYFE